VSRGKGKKKKFVETPPGDSSEKKPHLTPVPVGMRQDQGIYEVGRTDSGSHYGGAPVYESVDVPVGAWVNVPKGMQVVPGCYVDGAGIMRFKENNAPAVWHHPSGCKYHQPPCKRRVTDPKDIVYDEHNAPWCPDCIGWNAEDVEFKMRDASANAKVIQEKDMTLAEHVESIVGPFEESVEFSAPRKKLTEEDIQKLQAVTSPQAPEIFRGQASKQRFYPSGQPRRW
jgi:hypothetical protein